MYTYALTQSQNQHGEVFERALVEPVVITQQEQPSHVVLSAAAYEQLMAKIEYLEDELWGRAATLAEQESELVSSDVFMETLKEFANA